MSRRNIHVLLFGLSSLFILIPFVTAQLIKNGAYVEKYQIQAESAIRDSVTQKDSLTMSHPTLSVGSKVRLFNPSNGIAVFASVDHRILSGEKQPFRISEAAASQLGMTAQRAFLEMQVVEVNEQKSVRRAVGAARVSSVGIGSGVASYYGPGFHGRRTANGERFNQWDMTAAHRTLPFGTRVRVVNPRNGRSVVVRINDRGPFHGGRVIDLSTGAARAIGMGGTGRVVLERVTGTYQPTAVIAPVETGRQRPAFTLYVLKTNDEAQVKAYLTQLEGAWYAAEQEEGKVVYQLYYGLFETEDEATAAFSSVNEIGLGGVVKQL